METKNKKYTNFSFTLESGGWLGEGKEFLLKFGGKKGLNIFGGVV